ncbi:hypothetical protein LXD69_04850 [Flavobacterium sediminilitoris]|uniref:Uncharacterized protein n=1 Tax=Flavobacterium sediminilitoris TaxID=2024526 RepID=A0ABY4HQ87_9FLAO|nr:MULTISPECIES: hypothetical protein [Flavobacterium]UOX34840.1 hypothetical protein LXD69_04850 [Flavobacterium sediminilitoris]
MKKNAEDNNFEASYIYTPSGLVYSLKKDPKTGEYTLTVNKNLSRTNPSDENSNMRLNKISPNNTPQVLPLEGTINFQN